MFPKTFLDENYFKDILRQLVDLKLFNISLKIRGILVCLKFSSEQTNIYQLVLNYFYWLNL